jgi:protein phosphatase
MVREHNEDNFLIADLTQNIRSVRPEVRTHTVGARGTLFAVCDGMGGAAAGEVASQMAVDTIHDLVQNGPSPLNRDQFAHRMQMAIGEAGARIYLAAKSNRAQRGMGTTSTVAGVFEKTLFLGQVGDSRAYMVRAGKIKQLTKDQSLVSKLIEAGQLTEAEAESYEHSHIILQALGTSDTVAVDLSYMELRQGDCVLLCSDGLSGLITSEQMREILTTTDDPMEACKKLTDAANAAGGHDNVTVIVARFDFAAR